MKSRKPRVALRGALALAVTACAPPNAQVVTAPQAPAVTGQAPPPRRQH